MKAGEPILGESQKGFSEKVAYRLYMKKTGGPSGGTVGEGSLNSGLHHLHWSPSLQ